MTNDEEIHELRRSTTRNMHVDTIKPRDKENLQDNIYTAICEVESGDHSSMIGFRDQSISALLLALERQENGLDQLGRRLEHSLGQEDSDSFDRSKILRLAIRVGLQQAARDHFERLTAAKLEYTRRNL